MSNPEEANQSNSADLEAELKAAHAVIVDELEGAIAEAVARKEQLESDIDVQRQLNKAGKTAGHDLEVAIQEAQFEVQAIETKLATLRSERSQWRQKLDTWERQQRERSFKAKRLESDIATKEIEKQEAEDTLTRSIEEVQLAEERVQKLSERLCGSNNNQLTNSSFGGAVPPITPRSAHSHTSTPNDGMTPADIQHQQVHQKETRFLTPTQKARTGFMDGCGLALPPPATSAAVIPLTCDGGNGNAGGEESHLLLSVEFERAMLATLTQMRCEVIQQTANVKDSLAELQEVLRKVDVANI
eukprot:PhM_4_TR4672/c0_g1_i1/m.60430